MEDVGGVLTVYRCTMMLLVRPCAVVTGWSCAAAADAWPPVPSPECVCAQYQYTSAAAALCVAVVPEGLSPGPPAGTALAAAGFFLKLQPRASRASVRGVHVHGHQCAMGSRHSGHSVSDPTASPLVSSESTTSPLFYFFLGSATGDISQNSG